jgi:cysteine-rich repeat protein
LNLGSYECDDGNLVDGDGCDHKCMKENNAMCSTTDNKKDNCKFPSYKIEFTEGMYKANVIFNFPVENLESYLQGLKAIIKLANGSTISVNSTNMEISFNMDNIETTQYDKMVLELPAYPKQENGSSYLTTDQLEVTTLPNTKISASIITSGLM